MLFIFSKDFFPPCVACKSYVVVAYVVKNSSIEIFHSACRNRPMRRRQNRSGRRNVFTFHKSFESPFYKAVVDPENPFRHSLEIWKTVDFQNRDLAPDQFKLPKL